MAYAPSRLWWVLLRALHVVVDATTRSCEVFLSRMLLVHDSQRSVHIHFGRRESIAFVPTQ